VTDLEDRLRDAFAARAELVTPQSLRHDEPPGGARRLSRWIVPGVTALAVAATAAGVLVANAPARDAAEPGPAASPSLSVSPAPSVTAGRVPALSTTLKGSGWTVRVPSTWHASASTGTAPVNVTCVGPAEQPCQLRLAAATGTPPPAGADVLGGGLLAGFSTGGCRRVGAGAQLGVGTGTSGPQVASVTRWECGHESYEQVSLPARGLLAVAFAPDGPTVSAVVRTLRADGA